MLNPNKKIERPLLNIWYRFLGGILIREMKKKFRRQLKKVDKKEKEKKEIFSSCKKFIV